MHLLHLSGTSRGMEQQQQQNRSPDSMYSPQQPVASHSQHQQTPANLSPTSFHHPSSASTVTQTPILLIHPQLGDESQLPTPETLMDQSNPDTYHHTFPHPDMDDMGKMPFSDFLRDILYDQSLSDVQRLAEPQGLAVLNFCDDNNLDLKDMDFGLLNHWNVEGVLGVPNAQLPQPDDSVNITAIRSKLVNIWTQSPWRWTPDKADTGYKEQTNLPLPARHANGTRLQDGGRKPDRVIGDVLSASSRDKILAIILNNCRENNVRSRVASSFPSAEVMDSWIHVFLASHLCQVSAWIHYGSFALNAQWPEWLAIAASAGAVLTPLPTLRRFGFALQEAVRRCLSPPHSLRGSTDTPVRTHNTGQGECPLSPGYDL